MSTTSKPLPALDFILKLQKDLDDCAAVDPDPEERRRLRAAANALGRVRRSYPLDPPTPAAEDQGGAS